MEPSGARTAGRETTGSTPALPAENDNADWGRTVETAACERWQLEHVAGEVAAPGWYDAGALRGRRWARERVRFGRVFTPVEVKSARYRVREGLLAAVGAGGFGSPRTGRSSKPTASMRSRCTTRHRSRTAACSRSRFGPRGGSALASRRGRRAARPSGRPRRVRPVESGVRPGGRSLTRFFFRRLSPPNARANLFGIFARRRPIGAFIVLSVHGIDRDRSSHPPHDRTQPRQR
jgi:hypothetical protein